jgi:hypothetical protein
MPHLSGNSKRHLLDVLCLLVSANFATAYNTLTTPMVPFSPYKDLNQGGSLLRMLPALLWQALYRIFHPIHLRHPGFHLPMLQRPFDTYEDWFKVLLSFFALLGTLTIARRMLRAINASWGFEWMALGMALALYFDTILVLNRNLWYPYDTLALFFFTLLVYLAFQDRPFAFTVALIPAMLNKETAIVAILIFFGLHFGRRPLPRLIAICAVATATALATRFATYAVVAHTCPTCPISFEHQLSKNLQQLSNPFFWLAELSVFGFCYFAAILFWEYIPKRVRITSVGVYVVWLTGMTFVGILREIRIFSELSALLLLAVALGVNARLQTPPEVAAANLH